MPKTPALTGVASALPLPNTTPTPAAGEKVTADSVQQLAQELLNQDKSLETYKLSLSGGTMTGPISAAGISQQATFVGTATITAATNASPIVCTATAHPFTSGDQVTVSSATGNTAANGTWIVTKLTADTFSLLGSTGNGTFTGSASATRLTQYEFGNFRTTTRSLGVPYATPYYSTASDFLWWGSNGTGGLVADYKGTLPTNAVYAFWEIDAPHGCGLTSVVVGVTPSSSHPGIPNGLPTLTVYKMAYATGAITSLGSTTMGWAVNNPPYTTITVSLSSELVDATRYRYFAVLTSESGTNAKVNGFQINCANVTYSSRCPAGWL